MRRDEGCHYKSLGPPTSLSVLPLTTFRTPILTFLHLLNPKEHSDLFTRIPLIPLNHNHYLTTIRSHPEPQAWVWHSRSLRTCQASPGQPLSSVSSLLSVVFFSDMTLERSLVSWLCHTLRRNSLLEQPTQMATRILARLRPPPLSQFFQRELFVSDERRV